MAPLAVALAVLQSFGWTPVAGGIAIALKTFPTAVGPKVAHAYLSPGMLTGDYRSEGRNVLEPCITLLPLRRDDVALGKAVAQFATAADHAVAESYAARLLRLFKESP